MEVEIGRVTHFYNHLNVAVLKLNESLKLGDTVHFLGHTTDFIEKVTSLEINHHAVGVAEPGADVAIKVIETVHEHDIVLRIVEAALDLHPT